MIINGLKKKLWWTKMIQKMKNKKVLITGAEGFIGSHLTEELVKLGAKVTVFVKGNLENISHLKDKIIIVRKDITKNLEIEKYDVVFHLAAFIGIKGAMDNPQKVFNVNTYGTLNLLNACKGKVKKFIYLNTLGVYGNSKQIPVNEEQPTIPTELYAASKLAGENFVLAFGTVYDMDNIVIRSFNVYGPKQNEIFVIPSIMKQCFKKNTVKLGNLKSTRDFVFVKDVVDALIFIAKKGKSNNIYNVGTGVETSIGDLAKKIINLIDKKVGLKNIKNKRRNVKIDVKRSMADISKIKKLGWKPKVSLSEGLKITARYYKNGNK